MTIQTTIMKNALATAYKNAAVYGALTTTAPGSSTGTEVSGGSYARILAVWGTVGGTTAGVVAASPMVFNVPGTPTTVVGFEFFDLVTAGTYQDGCGITSQTFSSAGTYTITPTYTQT
jgi:hypothetical protein